MITTKNYSITQIMSLFADIPLCVARRRQINNVQTPFILILDFNTVLPEGYLDDAISELIVNPELACVAIPHNRSLHPVFGASIWRTKILQELYDYDGQEGCECCYMWRKVKKAGMRIRILNMRAFHNDR